MFPFLAITRYYFDLGAISLRDRPSRRLLLLNPPYAVAPLVVSQQEGDRKLTHRLVLLPPLADQNTTPRPP